MGTEGIMQFSFASVVEDVLQQQSKRLSDIDLASRMAEEASSRRYEAAGWLRKTVGVVGGKDLPAEPSEEGFRLALRSGIILCNVLNKIHPGTVAKVVEMPCDSVLIPDGAAISAYQYFENVRNFLVAIEDMGIPTFEASDLEQGGKTSRVVNCVLALKSYSEWKQGGGIGSWKFGGNVKAVPSARQVVRKNSEPFMNSLSRTSSTGERSLDGSFGERLSCSERLSFSDLSQENSEMVNSNSLNALVQILLSDKKQEDIPTVVENILSKVMEECERQLASQTGQIKEHSNDSDNPGLDEFLPEPAALEELVPLEMKDADSPEIVEEDCNNQKESDDGGPRSQTTRKQLLVEQQHKEIQELRYILETAKSDLKFLQMKYREEVSNLGAHLHGLAYAATGYKRVLEENRKLYNLVQDLKGNIRVYCRVRPFLPGQASGLSTVENIDEGSITIGTPSKYGKEGRKSFTFNKVFGPASSQEEVFADTQPLIRSVLDGFNVCIFAYGQTGSGKTYTMNGPDDLMEENMGVNYRALGDLFLLSEQRKDTISYEISVQMLEIYNEQVRDLLATDGLNKRLEIRNSSQKGLNVPDANIMPVNSTSDVIDLMNLGHKNRAVSSTAMNIRSSRSHSCLTVHVQGRDLASNTVLRGSMHLVDLAGSERVDKSEAVGDRLKEAQHINKSLSALGDVISSLAQKNAHVPYRNSKLTQLLQDSLGGQAKTLMFVHISPEHDAVGETISTLKFAERVSSVELGTAKANKESGDVKELKEQIATLKAALARKEGEPARLHHSRSSSPDTPWSRSPGSTTPSLQRYGVAEIDNMEIRNNPGSKSRRQSLDSLLMNSSPWPAAASPGLEKPVSGDWAYNVMVNKQDHERRDNSLGWENESRRSPDMLYPKQNTRSVTATPDDSDDPDATTSDSSEPDFLWQPNVPKITNTPTNARSKLKKPIPTQAKSPELRSLIPAPPTRRLSNGYTSSIPRVGKKPVSADGRRKPGSAK